jgi:phosphate transport system substrate-binding protein
MPETAKARFAPIFAQFFYYMTLWVVVFGLSGYRFDSDIFFNEYSILSAPYFLFHIAMGFGLFPVVQFGVLLIDVVMFLLSCRIKKKSVASRKALCCYGVFVIALSSIAGYQYREKAMTTLSRDYDTLKVEDDVALVFYSPFDDANRLEVPEDSPSLSIDDDYPVLDGATAAFPVYAAMAQAVYKGLDALSVKNYVQCTKTATAYERLADGKIDIFFGAQPSENQIEYARSKGVEFNLTPIGREAFVFFVNRNNPVDSLTAAQIRDIYMKRTSNWRDLGGKNERIIPFQRPENSGSQTIMTARVMEGENLPLPLREEYAGSMGGIVNKVAAYRNYSSAIGYSFRYFATGMKPNPEIKLIAIDEIAPSPENIRNGLYPFTVDVYAVTAGTENKNVPRLVSWILSDQGQGFIEQCGYIMR